MPIYVFHYAAVSTCVRVPRILRSPLVINLWNFKSIQFVFFIANNTLINDRFLNFFRLCLIQCDKHFPLYFVSLLNQNSVDREEIVSRLQNIHIKLLHSCILLKVFYNTKLIPLLPPQQRTICCYIIMVYKLFSDNLYAAN